MSHELRTPLNAVIGFSEVMRGEFFGPLGNQHYRDYANDIYESGTHLLNLINDILDLSKVEAGQLNLNEEVIELHEVLEACIRLVFDGAQRADLALTLECEASLPRVRADELKLKQVFLNLLSNATKFTPAGGSVAVTARRHHDGGVQVVVTDTGIGIKSRDLVRVLEPFQQVASTMSRQHQGTGLGLPLVKGLVELHDGRLSLVSEEGKGTTATIYLPAARTLENCA